MFGWKHINVDSEILRKTADNFLNNMPMTIAYPIGVFFYTHSEDLTKAIKTCLIQEAEKMTKEAREELDLVNAGDGGTP